MSDQEFYDFCVENLELRIERTPNGHIIILPPTTSETGRRNFEISMRLDFGTANTNSAMSSTLQQYSNCLMWLSVQLADILD